MNSGGLQISFAIGPADDQLDKALQKTLQETSRLVREGTKRFLGRKIDTDMLSQMKDMVAGTMKHLYMNPRPPPFYLGMYTDIGGQYVHMTTIQCQTPDCGEPSMIVLILDTEIKKFIRLKKEDETRELLEIAFCHCRTHGLVWEGK